MKPKMKVLIAYDGLNPISKFINDLKQAGLPKKADVLVLTAVDAFMPLEARYPEAVFSAQIVSDNYVDDMRKAAAERIESELKQAQSKAGEAIKKIKKAFPQWNLSSEGCVDSPAWAVIKKAEEWRSDLVVVGSHHQGKLSKFLLGSVAQKVVMEAGCAVRVVRSEPEENNSPARIVVGVDGSPDSELAVNAVAERFWKKGSAVHLITAVDTRMSTAVTSPGSPVKKWIRKQDRMEQAWIRRMSESFEKKLKRKGLAVSVLVKGGDPKRFLVEEASRWGADCIFVGARGLNMIERFFIGSVSAAVAARAHCSVEVIRPRTKRSEIQKSRRK